MPFDKLDKKAREAAEQYDAAYNEEAWSKMEALLDKHMPVVPVEEAVNKKNRFHEKWLLLLLGFIAISFFILLTRPWNGGNENLQNKTTSTEKQRRNNAINESKGSKIEGPAKDLQPDAGPDPKIGTNKDFENSSPTNAKIAVETQSKNANARRTNSAFHQASGQMISGANETPPGLKDELESAILPGTTLQFDFINQKIKINSQFNRAIDANGAIIPEVLNSDLVIDAKTKSQSAIKKNSFLNSLSLSISAGPDVSFTNSKYPGTMRLAYGAGISYKLNKRFSVRTGFYTVSKIYDAEPSQYNPPPSFWTYYQNLEEIYADCKVNEIPIILNYSFNENKKHAWFASAGLSSYFMKRETYTYHIKTLAGFQDKTYTIRGENKHYLSSLRISAGYEKTLNKNISFTAEPYLNLPLSGIGYGKVKLKSAGLLFSVILKPFAKKCL